MRGPLRYDAARLDWQLPDATPRTQDDLALFDHLAQPLWIFDFEAGIKWWANRSGLALWSVGSNAEMRARSPVPQMSEATRIRLDALRRRLARGEVARERWSFYPTGAPTFAAEVALSGIVIADARDAPPRLAMLVEARPLRPDDVDPFVRRGVEVLRYLDEMVSFYAKSGAVLMRNPAAVAALGDGTDRPGADLFAAAFADPADAARVRAALPFRGEVEVRTRDGVAWHDLAARESLDPVTGETGVLVHQRDVADRVADRLALEDSRRRFAAQAEELRSLAAAPLRLGRGLVAVPLIGRIDAARLRAVLAAIERQAAGERVAVALLELTGADRLEPDAPAALRRMIAALRLQGIAVRVVGVRPALALALLADGVDFGDVPLHASLADALAQDLAKS